MKSFRNRSVKHGEIVEVYRNLRTGGYSIRKLDGRVAGHADQVTLLDATFMVNELGRQRVLKEKRKNVHAWVRGFFVGTSVGSRRFRMPRPLDHYHRVRYNPYEAGHFYTADGAVENARIVYLGKDGVWAWRTNAW